MSSSQMVSSEEDLHMKRGGHRLFDHTFFPDAVILRLRGHNFIASASYLAIHSSYFSDLFYGPDSKGLNGRYELDYDPHTFGDLLDMIYPSFKKINCCVNCTSSLENRLNLALQLKLRFAVKRMIVNNVTVKTRDDIMKIIRDNDAVVSYGYLFTSFPQNEMVTRSDTGDIPDPLILNSFPDSISISLQGETALGSASILSLHSPALSEILYKDGQLTKEIHLDIDLNSYRSFLHSIIGEFPITLTTQFLDDLLTIGAKNLYDFYLSEILKKIISHHRSEASFNSKKIVEHCFNQSEPDMNTIKSVIRFVDREYLESLISKCTSLPQSDVEHLMKNFEESEFTQYPFQFYVKTLTGQTYVLDFCSSTLVLELKNKICEKTGIPIDQQRLIFGGRQMTDNETLGDCGVEKDSIVHLVLRLC